jgi:hypothetical protein
VEVLAVKRGALVREHAADDRRGFVEHVEARFQFREFVAVGLRFPEMPTGAEAEFEASAADVVERGCGLREQRGVAITDVEDEATEAGVLGFRRKSAERGKGLEVRLGAAGRWRFVEVIPCGNPVEARIVELAPQRAHLVHCHVLLPDVGAQRQCHIGACCF